MLPDQPDQAGLVQTARRALAHWPFDVAGLALISHTENVVFKATTADGRQYVVRIHRPGYSSLAALNSERAWTAALRAAGVGAPAGVPTIHGEHYAKVALPGGSTTYVGVLDWVEGELLADIIERDTTGAQVPGHFEELGRVAARIHNQASAWQIPAGFIRRSWDEDGLMGKDPLWGRFWELPGLTGPQQDLLVRTRERVYEVLRTLPKDSSSYSLIHSDLHPQNVVVTRDGLSVIDFDDSGFGWHVYELAVALFRTQGRRHLEAAESALIAGYRQERPLAEEQRRLLPMFVLVRGLAVLGWANARPELGLASRMRSFRERVLGQAEDFLCDRLRI
jgi:Ser/Thr protein kinase RdoA (MazF antagonist)